MIFVSVDLLQMLEFNVTVSFPAAPLLTVILALVGKCIHIYISLDIRIEYVLEENILKLYCSFVF